MGREFFLQTNRIGFSRWSQNDLPLATLLWGDAEVTKLICAAGKFSEAEIAARLNKEISNEAEYHVQYWPIFTLDTEELIGCCGLRPRNTDEYEIGFHLRPKYWRQGYASEGAQAVIQYAFSVLSAKKLFAGHNPKNTASQRTLKKLDFQYIGDEFYKPTGLYHPSYELTGLNNG